MAAVIIDIDAHHAGQAEYPERMPPSEIAPVS